ncbi:hypothetical protein G7066_08845 [Leucobacter coleopterorum]|uniref:Uncharacterized protein n=1 Tax=Leucobacter coleopterorum TaxID=2714933 RepID=A0ABX6K0U0_9MICO|nr:hypothetical protein [Leucobacter coleopterorum]QIM18690.1 hypothetical protein G7066_08845 [Leucobacter coleopterorum]
MNPKSTVPAFETPEGLRALLIRLHETGRGSWQHDAEAHDLAHYTAHRYARLAKKHGLDPWEAAIIAFEAMLQESTRTANNPWAAVTKVVKLKCYYEERAQGLLCSVDTASDNASTLHDAERFADRDQALLEYHTALHTPHSFFDTEVDTDQMPGPVTEAMTNATTVFVLLGWPLAQAQETIEYICLTLARMGNRLSAIESLRRDTRARAMLDISRKSWNAAIRIMLGTPNAAYSATNQGRGLLMRLVLSEPLESVFADDDLVRRLSIAAPASLIVSGLP